MDQLDDAVSELTPCNMDYPNEMMHSSSKLPHKVILLLCQGKA